ncbi:transposase [Streptomyces sp. NPDC001980]|uniref:transposase n=1 Tax=Streptomyces sp. NPDC001980 TaxID=3157126 RepID=UPI003327C3E0
MLSRLLNSSGHRAGTARRSRPCAPARTNGKPEAPPSPGSPRWTALRGRSPDLKCPPKRIKHTDNWRRRYGHRARVEGTVSQAVHAFGLGGSRYRSIVKTRLQHRLTGGAINRARLDARLTGHPLARARLAGLPRLGESRR